MLVSFIPAHLVIIPFFILLPTKTTNLCAFIGPVANSTKALQVVFGMSLHLLIDVVLDLQ
jgi:hypothetical protein